MWRPNGPELSCGNEAPQQRNPFRAWYVQSNCSWLFRACKIVDGYFRQLERLVSPQPELLELECMINVVCCKCTHDRSLIVVKIENICISNIILVNNRYQTESISFAEFRANGHNT